MDRKRIVGLRHKLGLNQEQFAVKLNVSGSTVRRWEKGGCKPLPAIERLIEELEEQTNLKEKNA